MHQEDERIVGSCKRPHNDVALIVLKADPVKFGNYSVYSASLFERKRELQLEATLNEGTFLLIPLTTGCMLQQPHTIKYPNISPYVVNDDGTMSYHPFVKSAFADLFKKLDLTGDGVLSAYELNHLGNIADMKYFKELKQESFGTKKMKRYSCTSEGLTSMGLFQIMMRKYGIDRSVKKLKKFGVNDQFYSLKSSVFMISLHSDLPVKLIVRDALLTDLNERARDMYVDYQIKNNPSSLETIEKQKEYELHRIKHKEIEGVSYFFHQQYQRGSYCWTTLVVIYLGHSSLYLGHSSLYHGHSSPISDTRHHTLDTRHHTLDTRHLSWTLVTYLGHILLYA